MALFFILAWVANIVALAVADWIFSGVSIDGWAAFLIGGSVLAIANTILKPILTLLTLPFVIVTLGLFLFLINLAMLALSEWIAPNFSIDGFWTYVGATIVIMIVNYVLHAIFGNLREKDSGVARLAS